MKTLIAPRFRIGRRATRMIMIIISVTLLYRLEKSLGLTLKYRSHNHCLRDGARCRDSLKLLKKNCYSYTFGWPRKGESFCHLRKLFLTARQLRIYYILEFIWYKKDFKFLYTSFFIASPYFILIIVGSGMWIVRRLYDFIFLRMFAARSVPVADSPAAWSDAPRRTAAFRGTPVFAPILADDASARRPHSSRRPPQSNSATETDVKHEIDDNDSIRRRTFRFCIYLEN